MLQSGQGRLRFFQVLIVIVLVAMAIGIFLPGIYHVRDGYGARGLCQNRLRQIALATANFANAYNDHLPAYVSSVQELPSDYSSIQVTLLPFIENQNLLTSMQRD